MIWSPPPLSLPILLRHHSYLPLCGPRDHWGFWHSVLMLLSLLLYSCRSKGPALVLCFSKRRTKKHPLPPSFTHTRTHRDSQSSCHRFLLCSLHSCYLLQWQPTHNLDCLASCQVMYEYEMVTHGFQLVFVAGHFRMFRIPEMFGGQRSRDPKLWHILVSSLTPPPPAQSYSCGGGWGWEWIHRCGIYVPC